MVRIFVGGLPEDVTEAQLKERFKAFGDVTSVTVPSPKSPGGVSKAGAVHRGFAYLELVPHDALAVRRCVTTYNGCTWRGGILRVEEAKPSYVDRLQADWAAEKAAVAKLKAERAKRDLLKIEAGVQPSPDKPRPLHILRHDGRKTMRVEPGRPKRYFPPARPIPLDQLPWTMPDPPQRASPSLIPTSTPAPKVSAETRKAAVPPPAALKGAAPGGPPAGTGRGHAEGAEGGERKRGERAARRALKSLLGDDLEGTDSDTGTGNPRKQRAVDFITEEDLPQALPAGPNADRFDSSDDDEGATAVPTSSHLPLRPRAVDAVRACPLTPDPTPHPNATSMAMGLLSHKGAGFGGRSSSETDGHVTGSDGDGSLGADSDSGYESLVADSDADGTRTVSADDIDAVNDVDVVAFDGKDEMDVAADGDADDRDVHEAAGGDDCDDDADDGDDDADDGHDDEEEHGDDGRDDDEGDDLNARDGDEDGGVDLGLSKERLLARGLGDTAAMLTGHLAVLGGEGSDEGAGMEEGSDEEAGPGEGTDEEVAPGEGTDEEAAPGEGTDEEAAPGEGTDEEAAPGEGTDEEAAPGEGTDEEAALGGREDKGSDVISAHVDGDEGDDATAGLAEAFPLGGSFWAGADGGKQAEAAWQAQRAMLLADYKRKRRDSIRHVPKRQRR